VSVAPRPVEQPDSQLLFHPVQRLAERRLRNTELVGRAREAARIDDREEVADVPDFHKLAL
jgi:hypothetical protein